MVSSLKRLSLLALFSWTAFSVQADYKDDIGYTALAQQLGAALPTGTGVTVSFVEADVDGGAGFSYMPSAASNVHEVKPSLNGTVSGHANMVGSLIY